MAANQGWARGRDSFEMRQVMNLLGLLIAAAVLILGLAWAFQRKLIYFPDGDVPPAGRVLPMASEVTFRTEDGLELKGWFLPAADPAGAVLVFNGNAGNRSFRAPLAAALAESGFSVLLFDYRGYGGNPGRPTEVGLLADARGARAYLEDRGDVDPARIVYFGESLGAAVALAAAVERPPAALVLRSPFTSMADVGKHHYPFLPVGLLLRDRYPSLERVGHLDCPLLVIAGGRDTIVPPSQSRALFEAAPSGFKRFLPLPGADHNDFELLAGPELINEVTHFFRLALEGKGAR